LIETELAMNVCFEGASACRIEQVLKPHIRSRQSVIRRVSDFPANRHSNLICLERCGGQQEVEQHNT